MALTKATTAVQASATNNAAASTTSSWIDARTFYGVTIYAKVTNGATGPTIAARFRVQVSPDNGTTIYDLSSETAALGNNVVTNCQPVTLPQDAMYYRTFFDQNTGQGVGILADSMHITAL